MIRREKNSIARYAGEEDAWFICQSRNYAIIGNMYTTALVGLNGSIDWFCFPHFDSPSVFARILDETKGGYFEVHPLDSEITRKQLYWPDTNVLVTRFFFS